MSQENAEVVRRAIESFEDDVETWLGTLDPAIEWHPQEAGYNPHMVPTLPCESASAGSERGRTRAITSRWRS